MGYLKRMLIGQPLASQQAAHERLSYIVSKENLGVYPGLIAGASLLVDYVLTVAGSISAGVAAITTAFPALAYHRVLLALVLILIVLITVANLRGMKESATIFAAPTYIFVMIHGGDDRRRSGEAGARRRVGAPGPSRGAGGGAPGRSSCS